MALEQIDVYSVAAPSYSGGARDTGSGYGLPKVGPFPWSGSWNHIAAPPNGMGYTKHFGICGAWYSGGYLYVVMDDITGTGRGIYRFAVTDGDPPTATYDSYVAWNTLGLAGTYGWWYQRGTSLYDPTDDAVFLATYGTGAAQTPCAGKWSMSNWPFASGNADWKIGRAHV